MKRILLGLLLVALPASAGVLEDIQAIRVLLNGIEFRLTSGTIPPATVPTIPNNPPATGPCDINGAGTLQPIYLPATITVCNVTPGTTLRWVKMPPIRLGPICMTEGGMKVGDCLGPIYDLPMGNHTFTFTPEVPGAVVSILVRPGS